MYWSLDPRSRMQSSHRSKKHGLDVVIVSKDYLINQGAPPWQKEATMLHLTMWMPRTAPKPT